MDKEFHGWFWPFFVTLTLQNLIVIGVNLSDNVMLGAYAESALAGAAAVNQIQVLMQMIINGAVDGAVVLSSQYWGQGRVKPIKHVGAAAFYTALAVSAVFFALVSLFPRQSVSVFTSDAAIVEAGLSYLKYIRLTYPLIAVTAALLAIMRSVETVKIALVVSAGSFFLNIFFNYCLIYGNFGAPELGPAGAALATLICRVMELVAVVCYVAFWEKKLRIGLRELFTPQKELALDYFKVSAPLIVIGLQYGLNLAVHTVILGHINSSAIAANSIAGNLVAMLKIVAGASATAAGVIIGKTVGRGDIPKVKQYTRLLQRIFICIGLCSCAVILLLRGPILSLYNVTEETRALAWDFLLILSLTNIGTAYQMPAATGIVRGGGDTKFVMVNDLISIWCILIPFSALAAFVFRWPATAVVICLYSDQVFKCLPVAIKVNRYNWMKNLTRGSAVRLD
ncbi:MAG: MATE family efflux transporter [Clostridiales bacterium]|jgi:putative MATE family efflux protein|nr:MATE family efflux transporter [Clostridiales bacterium]